VAAGDGQRVGAVRAHALPDAAGAPLQHGLGRRVQIGREHLADVAPLDQVTRVQDRRVTAPLQADDGLQRALAREPGHLLRLGQSRAQRPLTAHCLPGLQAGHHQLAVAGHPHADDDEVDLRMRRHVAEAVERTLEAERRGRRLGGVLVRGAYGLQLVVGQGFQGGHVGIRSPAAAPLGHRRSHDSHTNLLCHLTLRVRRPSLEARHRDARRSGPAQAPVRHYPEGN
jgi:hypothetical protein